MLAALRGASPRHPVVPALRRQSSGSSSLLSRRVARSAASGLPRAMATKHDIVVLDVMVGHSGVC
jgi:hypothetical protein